MRHKRYRLVKSTKASGFVLWVIQKKGNWIEWLFGVPWTFVDCSADEQRSREVLDKLIKGAPEETREVIFEQMR